jgi:hypothetical protein
MCVCVSRWPHLAEETSPQGVLATLKPHVPCGATVFIATNKRDPLAFFAPVGACHRVAALPSFPHVLDAAAFLPSTLALVDYSMLKR